MRNTLSRYLPLAASLALGGCSLMGIGPSSSLNTGDRVTVYGANPQFDNEKFEVVDLETLLDPDGLRLRDQPTVPQPSLFNDAVARRELERAFVAFYHPHYNLGSTLLERRNRLQDRLIAASNQRCETYKIYLRRFEAYQDTTFGLATTVLGGAAAIVGGIHDARILGGLAGIASGSRAELRQGLFGNLASYIIVPGMDQRRKELMGEIQARRPDPAYTVQAAISDVARYHGACTLETGMEQAKNAIQTVSNPGLSMVRQTLNSVMQARLMAQAVQKVGSGAPLSEEDLRVPSFTVDGVSVQGNAYTVSSGSALAVAVPATDGMVGLVRTTANQALQQVLALKTQTKDMQDGIAKELQATTPSPTKAILDVAKQRLGAADGLLDGVLGTLATTASTSLGSAATADACLQTAQFKVTSALPAARPAARLALDSSRIAVGAYFSAWSQKQLLQMAHWSETVGADIALLGVTSLRANGTTTPTPPKDLPETPGGAFPQFAAPDTTSAPACP